MIKLNIFNLNIHRQHF